MQILYYKQHDMADMREASVLLCLYCYVVFRLKHSEFIIQYQRTFIRQDTESDLHYSQ